MNYIETNSVNPYYNLAFEEYILTSRTEEFVMLWQNDNTIVIGQNQNTAGEINAEFVEKNGIRVVRRTTGGGAVYHDLGNLNYSFITAAGEIEKLSFSKFAKPVVEALCGLGLNATASGRNDIMITGADGIAKKVSGTAQRIHRDRVLFHGTLLFDSSSDAIAGALKVNEAKFRSKASKSVRQRVGNTRDFLREIGKDMELSDFWAYIKGAILSEGFTEMGLSQVELESVEKLKALKYDTWDWNYGRSPKYETSNTKAFPGGIIEVCYTVDKGGILSQIDFFGDFLSKRSLEGVKNTLVGCRFTKEEIKSRFKTLKNLPDYFGDITIDEILSAIFELNE